MVAFMRGQSSTATIETATGSVTSSTTATTETATSTVTSSTTATLDYFWVAEEEEKQDLETSTAIICGMLFIFLVCGVMIWLVRHRCRSRSAVTKHSTPDTQDAEIGYL
jgi:heme/copper-type cytochrome/quinol oxidase subunit 2